jgi:hypothetical protein
MPRCQGGDALLLTRRPRRIQVGSNRSAPRTSDATTSERSGGDELGTLAARPCARAGRHTTEDSRDLSIPGPTPTADLGRGREPLPSSGEQDARDDDREQDDQQVDAAQPGGGTTPKRQRSAVRRPSDQARSEPQTVRRHAMTGRSSHAMVIMTGRSLSLRLPCPTAELDPQDRVAQAACSGSDQGGDRRRGRPTQRPSGRPRRWFHSAGGGLMRDRPAVDVERSPL